MKRRNLLAGLFGLPIAAAAAVVAPKAVAQKAVATDQAALRARAEAIADEITATISSDVADDVRFYAETFRAELDKITVRHLNDIADRYLRGRRRITRA